MLEAALEARNDPDTVIVARTDARGPLGIAEAISRARRYADVGADLIFVEAPQSLAEVERVAAEVQAPLLLNVVPGGLTPEIDPARLRELGFRVAIHPGVVLGAIAKAAIDALGTLAESTISTDRADRADPAGFFDLFGLSDWDALGQRYSGYERPGAAS